MEPNSLEARDDVLLFTGRGNPLVCLSIGGGLFAFFLVFNRLFWRKIIADNMGPDDCAIMIACGFLIIQCGTNIVAVNYGYGQPFDSLPYHDAVIALQCFWLGQIFYKLTMNFAKIGVLILYMRVFTYRWWRTLCCYVILFVVAAMVSFTVATIVQCLPVSLVWEKFYASGRCFNILPFWYANSTYTISTDLFIVAMVMFPVWKLDIGSRQRWWLSFCFGLGLIVCMASVLRLTTLYRSSYSGDLTAGSLTSTVWTTAEASLSVICACLPMVRQIVEAFWPNAFGFEKRDQDRIDAQREARNYNPSASDQALVPIDEYRAALNEAHAILGYDNLSPISDNFPMVPMIPEPAYLREQRLERESVEHNHQAFGTSSARFDVCNTSGLPFDPTEPTPSADVSANVQSQDTASFHSNGPTPDADVSTIDDVAVDSTDTKPDTEVLTSFPTDYSPYFDFDSPEPVPGPAPSTTSSTSVVASEAEAEDGNTNNDHDDGSSIASQIPARGLRSVRGQRFGTEKVEAEAGWQYWFEIH